MKIICNVFEYVCRDCKKIYQAPVYVGGYGSFLLRNHGSSSLAFLDAIGDKVFKEVGSIVDAHEVVSKLDENNRADIFQKVIGYAYDPDELGNYYGIGLDPECVHCGSHMVDSYIEKTPIKKITVNVPIVTSDYWQSLSKDDRIDLINKQIKKIVKV